MSGWLVFFGKQNNLDNRLAKFKKIFSVPNVPELRTELNIVSLEFAFLGWAWNKQEIPDVYFCRRGKLALALAGVITGLGRFGNSKDSQRETANYILELWTQYGEKIIAEINGSFSFLLYDSDAKNIQAFTDRFASRPVCFAKQKDGWILGDSPAAIAATMKVELVVDPASLWSFLHLGRRLGRHTLFSGIKHILAGEKLILSSSEVENVSAWWQRRYTLETGISSCEWGSRIATALKASAWRYQKVCRNPHLFLSGGLDSRLAAAAFDPGLETITLSSLPNAETRAAARVARTLGHSNRVIVRSPYWYLETADVASLISAGDHLDQHTHFIVPVRDIIETNTNAEFFLGDLLENFSKHYFSVPKGLDFSYTAEFFRSKLPLCLPSTVKDPQRWGLHLQPSFRKKAQEAYNESIWSTADSLKSVSENDEDRMDCFLRWSDVGLTYTFNMLSCIRALAPERNLYFDNDLDDLSLKIPASIRGSGTLHRWALWHLNPKLTLIPEANTFLPPLFPRIFGEATKKLRPFLGRVRRACRITRARPIIATSGSWLLKHEMYRKDERYQQWIQGVLDDPVAFPQDIFDKNQILQTWETYMMGDLSLHFELEALLSFANLWRQLQEKS